MANKVKLTDINAEIELGNSGINLQVLDDGEGHRGHLQISKARVKWYRGKEQTPILDITLKKFIELAEAGKIK